MGYQDLGSVRSGKGAVWRVRWDPATRKVHVQKSTFTNAESCGTAGSASEAMHKAEAHLYNR